MKRTSAIIRLLKGLAMPIISVKLVAARGNFVGFEKTGGFIQNEVTGARTRFIERDGVYFLRMINPRSANINKGFGRLG